MTTLDFAPPLVPRTPTVVETLVGHLRQAIMSGALPGGAPIRQEEMSKKFGVSRVPLREALLRLEGEGLVETQPRRGVVVTSLDAEDFEEILEMRLALESLALRLAAPRFTPQDTAAVREVLEEAGAGRKKKDGPDLRAEFEARWGDLNWEFHRRLYAPAGRPRLLSTIENLHQLFARHLRMRMDAPAGNDPQDFGSLQEAHAAHQEGWKKAMEEHRLMLEACDRHDAEAACAVLQGHISGHGAALVHRLREENAPATPRLTAPAR